MLTYFNTQFSNSDMSLSNLIIFREELNTNKPYIQTYMDYYIH